MTLFLLGFVLGALLAGIAAYVVAKQQDAGHRREQALLHGRLRSLLCLVEVGALKPENHDAVTLLDDTHAMVIDHGTAPGHRHTSTSGSEEQRSITGDDSPEEEVRSIFHR
jgi:hypothetical protein